MESLRNRRRMRQASVLAGLLVGVAVVLIASRPADPSAQYFPTTRLVANPDVPVDTIDSSKIAKDTPPRQLPHGPIARPRPDLTPGAVAVKDVLSVCRIEKKSHALFAPGTLSTVIPPAIQQAVFSAYKIEPRLTMQYGLDFLVPLQLGGASVTSNIWPVPRTDHGLGFREKEILNIRMHVLVCHGEMPLAEAQKEIASDWVTLWIKYGA
ncbi:hypothetical protein EPN29_04520 [bacterium]|nr:MAG: hypothetical protein EPN29_04520 [bacterium]